MPHIRLKQDVRGIGKADTTHGVAAAAATKLVEQGLAEYLDFAGQPAVPPAPEPEGKTTDAVDTPALQDDAEQSGTRPRSARRRSASS